MKHAIDIEKKNAIEFEPVHGHSEAQFDQGNPNS